MTSEEMMRLQHDLQRFHAIIAENPLSSAPVNRSNEIIERIASEHVEEIAKELALKGLPSLDQLGMIQLRHGLSFALLHKQRIKTARKLQRMGSG